MQLKSILNDSFLNYYLSACFIGGDGKRGQHHSENALSENRCIDEAKGRIASPSLSIVQVSNGLSA
jgi:hypothetical protein